MKRPVPVGVGECLFNARGRVVAGLESADVIVREASRVRSWRRRSERPGRRPMCGERRRRPGGWHGGR
jgi:hypothetical protein